MSAAHATAKEPLRVLHTVSGLHVGGVGRLLLRNALALESAGIRNHIAYLVPNHRLEAEYRKAGLNPICLHHRHTTDGPRTLYRLIRLIREHDIDIVHTNHGLDRLYGGLAAMLTGVPAITTAHDVVENHHLSGGARLRLWVERQLLSQYIAVSAAVGRVCETSRGILRDRVRVIHSGIEAKEFSRPTADAVNKVRNELGLHDADPILINVGRLSAAKNQHHLIPMMSRVLKRRPQAKLLIVGDGTERARLETAIAKAGLQGSIRLLGMRSDVPELLALSTVFLFPSESEGLGLSVIEAMGAGKPVIAANVAPMDEVVEDGQSGLLVDTHDATAFADAVEQVLDAPAFAHRMGVRGQQIVKERFSLESTSRSMGSLYRDVVAARC